MVSPDGSHSLVESEWMGLPTDMKELHEEILAVF